jgi:hypothetical protein
MARNTLDTVLGILFIVFGILMVLGKFGIESLLPILGIVLIVAGILILMGKLPGGTLVGVAILVIGILLAGGFLHKSLPDPLRDVLWVINIALGIILIILGVQRLR